MARSRNIKPGFFTNGDLLECDPLTRILFAGLWVEADRRGILEDRPKTIKVKVLPGDACDVDAMLTELADRGFIERYEAGGARCIKVRNFGKHQTPHVKEPASTLPAPGETRLEPEETGQARQSPVQDSDLTDASPIPAGAVSSLTSSLIPDSLVLDCSNEKLPTGDAPQADAAPVEPVAICQAKPGEPSSRSERQKASDTLYERRTAIVHAYFRGLGIELDSLAAKQRATPSFKALTPAILDTPECRPDAIEPLTRYTAAAYREWRHGNETPSLAEVLKAFPEWEQGGRPERPKPKPTPMRSATASRASPPVLQHGSVPTREQMLAEYRASGQPKET